MLAIIGAGGHAKCVYECLYFQGYDVAGFFDDDLDKVGAVLINGFKILGRPEFIAEHENIESIFVAIGDNKLRLQKYLHFRKKGYLLPNAIHQKAHISKFAKIGVGNFFMGPAVINPGSTVGNYCIINTSATVGHDCILEDGVQIGPGVNLAGSSTIQEGAFIGIGAKVAPGVTIGTWAVVGAGSLVLDDLPGGTFCTGTPASIVRYL